MRPFESAAALWSDQRLRYLIIGGWNTAFGYGCFAALYFLLGHQIHYLVVAIAAHVIGVTQSFVTQRTLVFRSRAPWVPEYLRFHVSYLGLVAGALVVMPLLVELLGFSPLLAQALCVVLFVLVSYAVHRSFSFKNARSASRPPGSRLSGDS